MNNNKKKGKRQVQGSATITNRSPSQTPRGRGNRQIQTSTNQTNVRKALRLALFSPIPWVLFNFPPCRGPGGSIPTGNVACLVSCNCPLWEERRGNTTRLPWVATRKPEEGILEVESYWEFVLS